MTALYTQQQIIYALNSIANAPSGRHGTVAELESYAKNVITKVFANSDVIDLIGEWSLVWGPSVYQAPGSTVADNAMYVAQSLADPSQLVVAISGTNPISAYGWIVEDIKINPTVPWAYGNANPNQTGDITQGTFVGLNVLLNTLQSNNHSLIEYLATQVSKNANPLSITVTGHSLGGALSPATALALLDTQGVALNQPNGWDPAATSQVFVEPTAGPTPGNITWRDYYDSRLGANTNRLWNGIDIVPHAWQLSMLNEIPAVYAPTIPTNPWITALVRLAEINSILAGDLQQICPTVAGLPGTVDSSITLSIKDILEMLETLLANKLLDRLAREIGLSANELSLATSAIDDLIKYLNSHPEALAKTSAAAALTEIESVSIAALKVNHSGTFASLVGFLDFLIQAAYQHTVAYSVLLGTTAYSDLVSAIEAELA